MYDELSNDYDRFVNWESRLAIELPFIQQQLQQNNAKNVLDAATGTGMHAIALAQHGYQAAGADLSYGMIEKARQNAASANLAVRFEIAGFGDLSTVFGSHSFDALLCLGNSLPHLLSRPDLDDALIDFARCLKPGGILMVQNRNFDFVMNHQERWMEPQSHSEAGTEWIFQRFYDFEPNGLLTFNMVILKRVEQGKWTQKVVSSHLRPILKDDLNLALARAGFQDSVTYASMAGAPFDPETSPNLVIVTKLPRGD